MGTEETEDPQYQVGKGCLIDQLLGQYLAHVTNLGPLVSPANVQTTLRSIYAYNYKRTLVDHDNVERTFALNNEAAMVICDYGKAPRPRIPFPYFAEVMTGFEHATAALMIYSGMVEEGVECIHNVRARYDGEKRSPWDEAECGHHYARAMASWTSFVALSGFQFDGPKASVVAVPRSSAQELQLFLVHRNRLGNVCLSTDCRRRHSLYDSGAGGHASLPLLRNFRIRIVGDCSQQRQRRYTFDGKAQWHNHISFRVSTPVD